MAVLIYISTISVGGFLFSIPSPSFAAYKRFDYGHSDQCEVIPHGSFDLHFSILFLGFISFNLSRFLGIYIS